MIRSQQTFLPQQPALDQIGPQRRIDENAPLLAATIGGRPVILARPDRPDAAEGADYTVPITMSRFRHALDIESGKNAAPYVPSMIDDFPIVSYQFAGTEPTPVEQHKTLTDWFFTGNWPIFAGIAVGAGIGALVGGHDHRILGAVIGGVAAPILGGALIIGLWANR